MDLKEKKHDWQEGLAISLLVFLLLGLPLFAIILLILIIYTSFRWFAFINAPSLELAMANAIITFITIIIFILLKKLIKWLKN